MLKGDSKQPYIYPVAGKRTTTARNACTVSTTVNSKFSQDRHVSIAFIFISFTHECLNNNSFTNERSRIGESFDFIVIWNTTVLFHWLSAVLAI